MWVKIKKIIHPLLLKIIPTQRTFELKLLNQCPRVVGAKIFAMNHSNCHDALIAGEAIREHFFVLVGKQRLEILDRIFFWMNGVIYVNRKNKKSKLKSVDKMDRLLKIGENILMYPEGTWNLTPSKPILPLYWGIIDLAKSAKVPIVPLIAEYTKRECWVKFGAPIYLDENMSKQDGIMILADEMATLKWDIWEIQGIYGESANLKKDFEMMIKNRFNEYPKLDWEYEKSIIREFENNPENIVGLFFKGCTSV